MTSPWHPLPSLDPPVDRAPALRRLQTRFGCLDRRQALLPALQLLGQLVAPQILAPTLVFVGVHHPRLRQQRLDLRLQASRLFAHPLIAHRLALARLRAHLRPVDRELAKPRQSHLARHLHHPHKQLAELRQMSASELTYRAMLREVARREHPKRDILLQLPRHRARGECAPRVGIDQHLDPHRRLVGGVASTVPLVGRIERRQVQCIDHIADVMSQVPWGNPLLQVRRHKQGVGPAGRHETWSASGVPTRNWRIGSYFPLRKSTHNPSAINFAARTFLRRTLLGACAVEVLMLGDWRAAAGGVGFWPECGHLARPTLGWKSQTGRPERKRVAFHIIRGRWALRAPEQVRWQAASTCLSTWPPSPSA